MEEQTQVVETGIAEQKAATWYERIAEMKIVKINDFLLLGDWLREIKRVVNLLDDETKSEIDQAHKLHKALIARRKKWSDKFEEAESLAKDKMKHYVETCDKDGVELPKVEGITVSETWSGDVIDASLLPPEYLMPDLDKLKGVTKSLKEATNIPGWKARSVKTLSVRV